MKISRHILKKFIKEELGNTLKEGQDQDPLVKLLDLLEDILSEVEIDAGAYDEPKRATDRDQTRAWVAQNYLPELNAAVELLRSIVEKSVEGTDNDASEAALRLADEKAAAEILSTRMGSYRGTTLPGGEKIK